MSVSLYGAHGKKVSKIELEVGTPVICYTSGEAGFFGVVMAMTQPRHYAINVLSQTGNDDEIVGKPLIVRISRNENEMVSQSPLVIPVAAVHAVSDIVEVWWISEEAEQATLQERVDLVCSVTGGGRGLGIAPQPAPQVS